MGKLKSQGQGTVGGLIPDCSKDFLTIHASDKPGDVPFAYICQKAVAIIYFQPRVSRYSHLVSQAKLSKHGTLIANGVVFSCEFSLSDRQSQIFF